MSSLFTQAILKFFSGVLLVGALIFIPAGTLSFDRGWLLMGILFIPMLIAGIIMLLRSPELLKKRLNSKETTQEQSAIVKLIGLMFLVGFIVAGLNFRFGWHILPLKVSIGASIVCFAAYLLYAEVLRENAFLSRTVEIQEHQTVITTGLYGIVRHPMYSATLFLFLSMPLILGSLLSFLIFLVYPFLIAGRIRHEEQFLEKELEGYREYQTHVKYRLIPFIW